MDKDTQKSVYRAFLSREGPQKLGAVEWPAPKQGVLRGTKLLVTGVLETIERERLNQLLVDCSGHVMSGISKKLDILIVGRDAGPTKLQKALDFNLKQMGEHEFYEFLKEKLENYDPEADDAPDTAAAKRPAAKRSQKKSADDGDGQEAKPKSAAKKTKK